ncbi:hypothetical protein CP973_21740 [Streptomyces albofaciens JCM 4342]|nr:hypothetical protein CP973_21740 [Streptomyces albofaciens JCM 4342]
MSAARSQRPVRPGRPTGSGTDRRRSPWQNLGADHRRIVEATVYRHRMRWLGLTKSLLFIVVSGLVMRVVGGPGVASASAYPLGPLSCLIFEQEWAYGLERLVSCARWCPSAGASDRRFMAAA